MSYRGRRTNFDLPGNWDPLIWQNHNSDQERAMLAAKWLPETVKSVLDIGCGNGVYTNLTDFSRSKVGLDLSLAALVNVTAPHVQSDAAQIPFEDNAFDAIVSMEMLEHIPVSSYRSTLNELIRVAHKYILITVPYNENLIHNRVICPMCGCAFHPYHHLRRFTQESLEPLFGPKFHLDRFEGVISRKCEILPGILHLISLYNHREGRNYPSGIVCPQCGYLAEDMIPSGRQSSRASSIRQALHHIWPKRNTFTWWMAIYRKVSWHE